MECDNCKATWQPTILDRQGRDLSSSRDLLGAAILASAVAVAAANGRVDSEEVDLICTVIESVTGSRLDPKEVERAASSAGGAKLRSARGISPVRKWLSPASSSVRSTNSYNSLMLV